MLEYFTYKKFKKHKAEKEAAQKEVEKTEEELHPTGSEAAAESQPQKQENSHSNGNDKLPQLQKPEDEQRTSSDEPPTSPVLDTDDESWIQALLEDDSPPPPLPPRVKTPSIRISSDSETASMMAATEDKGKEKAEEGDDKDKKKKKKDKKDKGKEKEREGKDKDEKHPHRISLLFSRNKKHGDTLKPEDIPTNEEEREKSDLATVLNRLNLSAKNNKAISLSPESSDLLQRFTQVFKDLVNGVPTAYRDLTGLIEDRDGALNRGFEKLPSSLKKLVTQLPEKLTSSLAPELLAAAAESQGLKAEAELGVKEAAKKLLVPGTLAELVTKPGAIVSMLKAIVNALKVRWPAFIGTNVLWSVALFLLMFVLWYCHKRGREVRLEGEEKAAADAAIDGKDRVEELPDDPLLPAPETASTSTPAPGAADVDATVPVEAAVPR